MIRLFCGDALDVLKTLPDGAVQMIVTSPPYYGLRSYLADDDPNKPKEIGLQASPAEYIARLVEVFREARRVLRDDGTLWVNVGDSYAGMKGASSQAWSTAHTDRETLQKPYHQIAGAGETRVLDNTAALKAEGYQAKSLLGIPWRLAFALQDDGWILRSDIIWEKPNPMPESVKDRPTRAHEYVFLFAKQRRYFWDAEAVREAYAEPMNRWGGQKLVANGESKWDTGTGQQTYRDRDMRPNPAGRNLRTVWTICTMPYRGAHFATFPEKLAERCVKAGTSERGACPICGKPWERVVEKSGGNWESRKAAGAPMRYGLDSSKGTADNRFGEVETRTLGWRPGCKHDAEPIHCVVLDPFNGAGTTGLVCAKLGRDYVGIDLKAEYIEMSRARISGYAPLLVTF